MIEEVTKENIRAKLSNRNLEDDDKIKIILDLLDKSTDEEIKEMADRDLLKGYEYLMGKGSFENILSEHVDKTDVNDMSVDEMENIVKIFAHDTHICAIDGIKLKNYQLKKHNWTKEQWSEYYELYVECITC